MTINKAQGHTCCGVNLGNNCFSRGQLYLCGIF
ncbi:hypothetical protein FWK35_00014872 [Aphis craccivora]|uniref:ATP-dependent DNA helicase PIF1-like n=1 Tax=Aphis craccivora TaxID=307492 RepID=A0A6G0YAT9_APHCR|nr:hypothetical protein FWK35_00014872 [Aphis craccivora]